jgi:hypothetical protein
MESKTRTHNGFTKKDLIKFLIHNRQNPNVDLLMKNAGLEKCKKLKDFTSGAPNCGNPFSELTYKAGIDTLSDTYTRNNWDRFINEINRL